MVGFAYVRLELNRAKVRVIVPFVWLGKLAREGNLHYADKPAYFKRAYAESTHAKYHRKDRLWKRAVWIEFGLGMLEAIWPVVSSTP